MHHAKKYQREKDKSHMISHICGMFLKDNNKNKKNQAYRYGEQIGGCQGKEWKIGENSEWVKRYRLPVIK